jgi:flagellar biogenesis protein FliO
LAVVDVLPLGKRQRAVVVRCYDRNFLIGLGEKEVSLLAELDLEDGQVQVRPVPPPAEAAETAVPAAPELPQNFAEVLAEEVPLRQATVKPEGPQRMPKEGLLG